MTANGTGVFCVSIDSLNSSACSIETARRQRELAELLDETRIPSNWMLGGGALPLLRSKVEMTVAIPPSASRGELLEHLRRAKTHLARLGQPLSTIAADPCQAKSMWQLLVRQGCVLVRPRSTEMIRDDQFQSIRGGLWLAPLCCSFVGGSRRSVQSLLRVCQRKMVDAADANRMFHVSVEVGNSRESWSEEIQAFRSLLLTAYEEKARGRLEFATLSEAPRLLGKLPSGKPMSSILRAA